MHSVDRSQAFGGWLAGCAAATCVIYAFALVTAAVAAGGVSFFGYPGSAVALLYPAVLVFVVTCLVTAIPAAVAIWLSEKFRWRSVLFFCCAGAAIGGLSQNLVVRALVTPSRVNLVFVAAGLAAGLTYWFVAGKRAGGDPA